MDRGQERRRGEETRAPGDTAYLLSLIYLKDQQESHGGEAERVRE